MTCVFIGIVATKAVFRQQHGGVDRYGKKNNNKNEKEHYLDATKS